MLTTNQPSVRQKFSNSRKAANGVDFIEQSHRENTSDSGDGLKQVKVVGIVNFGGSFKLDFRALDECVIVFE
jgi:hypothetical protein